MEYTHEDEMLVLALGAAYQSTDRDRAAPRVHIKLGGHTTLAALSTACFSDALQHAAIAPVVGCGMAPNHRLWTATTIAHGTNLFDALTRGSLAADLVVDLIYRVASALEHAHARGAVHRTLTPRGITIRIEEGCPVSVAGWTDGLIDPSLSARTAFTAPEMGRQAATDGRVDVYALGVIAYRALTGELPAPGSAMVPSAPPEVSALIVDMLAPVPRYRPTSAVVRQRAEDRLGIPSQDLIQTFRGGPRFAKPKWTPPVTSGRSGDIVSGEILPTRDKR